MIYPCQIRAARALIGMSQQELAARSSVGLATIKRIEAVGSDITGTAKTLVKIQSGGQNSRRSRRSIPPLTRSGHAATVAMGQLQSLGLVSFSVVESVER